jgi:Trk K+ transport system NAD-binding subunit
MSGETYGDLDLPEGTRGIALIREEEERLIEEDVELREGDHILFVLDRDRLDDLSGLFKQD